MTWFLFFAAAVFAIYFWVKRRQHQKEMSSPLAAHRLGVRYIGESLVLEQPIQNNNGFRTRGYDETHFTHSLLVIDPSNPRSLVADKFLEKLGLQ